MMKLELITGTGEPHTDFPARLARWLTRRTDLIGVIVELRLTGRAPDAVAGLLALPDVDRIRTEWASWLGVLDDADRAAALLLDAVQADVLFAAIFTFWGTTVRTGGLSNGQGSQKSGGGIQGRTPRTCRHRHRRPPC